MPDESAEILGYTYPEDLGDAFECNYENGFSGLIWIDPDKGDGAGDYMGQLDVEARLQACNMTAAGWPAHMVYWGVCSSAWVKDANVAGYED